MEKKAVIYIRVSDPSQVENNSLETQKHSCIQYAKSKGYEVVQVFREEGQSAKEGHVRPEFRKLLTFCSTKKNLIEAVVVYKYDRFSRSLEDALATISYLAKYKVEVISVVEPSEQGAIGKALRNIMFTLAELDNELKGERVKENMMAVFRKGLWPFKPPVGYRRRYKTKEENRGISLIKDTNLAPIISNMFSKAATGIYNKMQLARIMNLDGFGDHYKSKASHKIVDNILKKSFYYGYMYAPKWNEYSWGKHEPLVDEKTYSAAFNKVILKKKNYSYKDSELYPLKGLIKCDLCGSIMTSCPSRGRSKVYYYYECRNSKCRKLRIDSKLAHENFIKLLKDIKPSKRVIKLFTHMVFSEWDKTIEQTQLEADRLDERMAKFRNEINSIRKSKDDGFYTVEEAKNEADKIRKEIVVLEVEKSDLRIEQYNAEIVREFIDKFLMNISELWEKLDLAKKQTLQNKIFPDGIYITKTKEIRTINLSPSFKLIQQLKSENGNLVTPQGIEP